MKSIEISIEKNMQGTAAYVANVLSARESRITYSNGSFRLEIREKGKESGYYWKDVCWTNGDTSKHSIYGKAYDKSLKVSCVSAKPNYKKSSYLFDELTPAAEKYVDEFIQMCANSLVDFYYSDLELVFNLEIK